MYAKLLLICLCFTAMFCANRKETSDGNEIVENTVADSLRLIQRDSISYWINIPKDIKIKNYFPFMDSLVAAIDTLQHPGIDEYVLVHSNAWIIDSLRATDYYQLMAKGIFIYDQSEMVILHAGDSLAIPDSIYTAAIKNKLNSTIIDLNIPEFTLRIYQLNDTILACPVRVGRNQRKYIYVIGRTLDLKTPVGVGEIIRTDRMHKVINLDTGKPYTGTNRDDGKFTKLPIIPWIEPSINGIQYGSMIHPTTNPATLGKAYSHGCVGTREADAWTIYYNAPVGTKVIFRYDLKITDAQGDTILLNDIYNLGGD